MQQLFSMSLDSLLREREQLEDQVAHLRLDLLRCQDRLEKERALRDGLEHSMQAFVREDDSIRQTLSALRNQRPHDLVIDSLIVNSSRTSLLNGIIQKMAEADREKSTMSLLEQKLSIASDELRQLQSERIHVLRNLHDNKHQRTLNEQIEADLRRRERIQQISNDEIQRDLERELIAVSEALTLSKRVSDQHRLRCDQLSQELQLRSSELEQSRHRADDLSTSLQHVMSLLDQEPSANPELARFASVSLSSVPSSVYNLLIRERNEWEQQRINDWQRHRAETELLEQRNDSSAAQQITVELISQLKHLRKELHLLAVCLMHDHVDDGRWRQVQRSVEQEIESIDSTNGGKSAISDLQLCIRLAHQLSQSVGTLRSAIVEPSISMSLLGESLSTIV